MNTDESVHPIRRLYLSLPMSSGNAQTALIACIEEEIAHMEEEKAHIEKEIARMDKEKTRMKQVIRRKTAFLSSLRAQKRNSHLPIFRLPPEILAIILILGAHEYRRYGLGLTIPPVFLQPLVGSTSHMSAVISAMLLSIAQFFGPAACTSLMYRYAGWRS